MNIDSKGAVSRDAHNAFAVFFISSYGHFDIKNVML